MGIIEQTEKEIIALPGLKTSWHDELRAFRALFKFDNSYGASIVRSKYSYGGDRGLFELAVIYWVGDDWDLTYTTPITNDVCGFLSVDAVKEKLIAIQSLNKDNCYYDWDKEEED